ncbi:hypothetical protein LMG33810_001744 [Carnimonas sp. LMG 33810]
MFPSRCAGALAQIDKKNWVATLKTTGSVPTLIIRCAIKRSPTADKRHLNGVYPG